MFILRFVNNGSYEDVISVNAYRVERCDDGITEITTYSTVTDQDPVLHYVSQQSIHYDTLYVMNETGKTFEIIRATQMDGEEAA